MKISKNMIILGTSAFTVAVLAAIIFFLVGSDPVEKQFDDLTDQPASYKISEEDVLASIKMMDAGEGHYTYESELTFEQTVALLRKKYGAHIEHPSMQMRMLDELINYLKGKHPNDWVNYLHELLSAAFPNLASKLFRMSESIYKYGKFLEKNQARAALMGAEDRDKLLWEERRELFGEDSELIWGAELKQRAVQDALQEVEKNKGVPIPERLGQFKEALEKTYGETLPSVMNNRRQNFLDGFVGAVQEDLRTMQPSQRREALHEIREGLGLDEGALTRWDALDAERDQRWSNGKIYMTEKKELESRYSGEERDKKLDELRKRLFGEEGETIKNEETSGYNRFQGQQQFGIN